MKCATQIRFITTNINELVLVTAVVVSRWSPLLFEAMFVLRTVSASCLFYPVYTVNVIGGRLYQTSLSDLIKAKVNIWLLSGGRVSLLDQI